MEEVRARLAGSLFPAGVEGVEARFVRLASGLRVRVVEAGDHASPPIVLVPGWGCSAWIYHDTLVPLAESGFHSIAVELKGHGLSDKPTDPAEYTAASMAAHLIDILDAFRIDRARVVGHSMGAAIAVHAASGAPERFAALALAAPVGFAGVKGMALFRAITPALLTSVYSRLATPVLIKTMLRRAYGSLRGPTSMDAREFHAPTQFPEFATALRHLLHQFEWNARFPELRVPVMAIAGTEDVLCAVGDLRRYAETTIVVEKAGHVLFNEAPSVVNRELAAFFASGA